MIIKSNLFQCKDGVYEFENVNIEQRPNTYTLLEIEFEFFDQY